MQPSWRRRASLGIALVLVAGAASGCAAVRRVVGFKEQAAQAAQIGRIDGRIDTEGPSEGTLVVMLARVEEDGTLRGVDTFVRVRPGNFRFAAPVGTYQLGAYEDRNKNGLLDLDERVSMNSENDAIELGVGGEKTYDLLLRTGTSIAGVQSEPMDIFGLVERDLKEQRRFSLWSWSVQGDICEDLDDPAFGPDAGQRGLWETMDFLTEGIAGIYFMQPYDPGRIPVLFVHGISGYPQEFSTLIKELDRERFQPWFYFYPSGFGLDGISEHLAQLLERLAVKHDFDEIAVVAHSMGGLVSRGAILKYGEEARRDDVRLFVSISTPWGGSTGAQRAEGAPIQLPPSFSDMSPSSDYLRWVFYEGEAERRLPRSVEYHMLYGFKMSSSRKVADDGTVTLASQLRPEVQEQARSQRGFDRGHADILHAPEVVARLNLLLAQRFD